MSREVHAGFCERRGVRFPPATHPKVYVRSERAGQRVMASLTEFIERRLRLKVNKAKSAVARPEDRHFLGFRLRLDPHTGTVEVLLSERSKRNAMQRVRDLTPRTWGSTETQTDDRTQPHQAGRQAGQRVATALLGTEVLVGAEPHARRRSGPAQRVLRQARADLPGRPAPPSEPADRRPRTAATGAMGMIRGRSNGRRRGS